MIKLEGKIINYDVKRRIRIKEMLEEISLSGELVVVKINGKVVTEYDEVNPGDEIELIRISSGG